MICPRACHGMSLETQAAMSGHEYCCVNKGFFHLQTVTGVVLEYDTLPSLKTSVPNYYVPALMKNALLYIHHI